MKRNKNSTRTMRLRSTAKTLGTKSKYARKVARGRQMYGAGHRHDINCCGHDKPANYNQKFVVSLRRENQVR